MEQSENILINKPELAGYGSKVTMEMYTATKEENVKQLVHVILVSFKN